jgi:hypothetical protein
MTPLAWAAIAAAAVLVIAAAVGLAQGKGPFGVLIDQRGRYSLSRLQALLWTAVIIGTYFGIALPKQDFVALPSGVLGVMGISLGSSVLSSAIKANQTLTGQTADETQRSEAVVRTTENEVLTLLGAEDVPYMTGDDRTSLLEAISEDESEELNQLIQTRSKPSWMDVFSQEQRGTEHLIDIGKLQMFAWSLAALFLYGSIAVSNLTKPLEELTTLTALPDVSGTMLALMGLSQAAYLGMKLPQQSRQQGLR